MFVRPLGGPREPSEILGPAGAGSVVNRNNEKIKGGTFLQWPLDESALAASYVQPRLAMMDELGVSAQIMFPNVVGFGGQGFPGPCGTGSCPGILRGYEPYLPGR